ncbi:MAG TPA: MFS transporter [Chitinophagaceae bacterium]|jgi:FHS family L-fucose permease-like MFS transporter|nr:MFS transporter [Chitinophagaceae bacterium]HMU57582.1 MFS transporter [Chitinophagaceae bacterium]
MNQQTKWSQFGVLVSVFFFWGFVAASNDILIPVFKEKLHLTQVQAQMVSFAFYVAYSVGSILYFIISRMLKQDLLNKIGYKNGISIGLIISAVGTLLFIPAAGSESFPLFISGLFIIGLGFSLQQTAANPLAINMGSASTGSQRLSMAGGINNLGTTIGPLIVKLAIFGSVSTVIVSSLSTVKTPYLILGAAFLIVAAIFYFSSVPNQLVSNTEDLAESVSNWKDRGSPFKYPQLVLGMIAIFVYVGVEVSTAANLPEYMKQKLGTPTSGTAPYISLFWASLMIGRWTSSAEAFGFSASTKKILQFLMPYLAFGVFLLVNSIAKSDLKPFYVYAVVILVLIAANFLSKGNPSRQLLIFSICGISALLVAMFSPDHNISVYAICSVGLFCSTLWPCIFTLSISGLGKHTSEGSNFLIFMICGGGLVSVLQGYLSADHLLGISMSYVVGIACFAYLAYYAIGVKGILKSQGIDYDHLEGSKGGH